MPGPKRILIVVTSHNRIDATRPTGLWFEEFATPYQQFVAQGFEINVASPRGGSVPIDPRSQPQPTEVAQKATAQALQALEKTQALSEVKASDFDAIFLPGGHGTMFDLPQNSALQQLLSDFARADKVIAAVCHGPAGLVGARLDDGTPLVAGKTLTAFTNEEEQAAELDQVMPFLLESRLRELGGNFVVKSNWTDHVERDGKLITGQNPQSSQSVAQAVIKALNASEVSA
ncbi:type 1 glutamine amidotransferase domain-containing protein [Ktedonosporobacter rubrisoli]|uniref:Type 1 glutamine amidotransferase domain-containing protein n=1 Tax=Ktedonosporobacter rubrisoli TaxID=2509675 RepID=A0A4P6JZV1_KTERU|nr:type 1 glutamine amidotransferase domain-containing protein [Ktedonosporobacter rubrisoli]QBD81032.1 type 1 glutamine amidotransferase domain-containing protein [Ktedonosporobacter rubrisoli]